MRTILLASFLAAMAVPAFAASSWTAAPAKPSHDSGFVGSDVIWNCSADGCISQSDTSGADDLAECRSLARELGQLTAFTGVKPFDNARLAECNQVARKS